MVKYRYRKKYHFRNDIRIEKCPTKPNLFTTGRDLCSFLPVVCLAIPMHCMYMSCCHSTMRVCHTVELLMHLFMIVNETKFCTYCVFPIPILTSCHSFLPIALDHIHILYIYSVLSPSGPVERNWLKLSLV